MFGAMRAVPTVVAAILAIGLGLGLGILLTAAAVRSDAIGTKRIGAWRLFTDVGSPAIDPYQRARMARTGEVPLASAEGLMAEARDDSAGQPLDGQCSYRLSGPVPPARFWTVEAASTTGLPFPNPAGREAFTSADVLRDISGHFAITLAPTVEPGNWLPLPGAGHFAVTLRLYETALAGAGAAGTSQAGFPTITRVGCGR